ncbi:MAG: TetR/AcrR family transcriptional regulator [Acidobacteria bacterium]|nr:TetR/AcrR family transcriptional regulator [Acidobacteriota bacterium]
MLQVERSERSRTAILDAALELFSHRGYGATSMRDIAGKAGVSTGSVYHHFQDKEAIFLALLEQFQTITKRRDFPINTVLERGEFLDDFASLASAAQEVLAKWRPHLALFYVDAVEFDGRHIQRFYADLAARFEEFAETHRARLSLDQRFREDVPLAPAMLFATRVFIYYFSVESIFGVEQQMGRPTPEAIALISGIMRRGMLRPASGGPEASG